MKYVGIDWAYRQAQWCALAPGGEIAGEGRIAADRGGLARLVLELGDEVKACLEMMSGALWVRDQLVACGWQVEVADARKVKTVAPLAAKTDKVDDGKEGVDGSSPSEGSAKTPHVGAFSYVFSRCRAPEGVDGAVYGAFASRARLDASRRSQGMARGGGIAPVALTRSLLRFGERASEVRAPHASPGKVVERPADSAFQARPELAAETHDDFAALAAGAGDEFPCAGAVGVEHVRVDDGLPDGAGLRPVVTASLPEDTEQKQPFRDLGEVCSLLVHTQVLVLRVRPQLLAPVRKVGRGLNHLFRSERRRCRGRDLKHCARSYSSDAP